jgi:hypothetical protein
MNDVWVFTSNNARLVRVEEGADLSKFTNYVMNPSLVGVRGVPPHYWLLVDGKVVPMNYLQRKERDALHAVYGVDNGLPPIGKKKRKYWWVLVVAAGAAAVAALKFKGVI